MINLPSYEWFMGNLKFRGDGNVYSGSFGTDPSLGVTENSIRYRVWIEKDENDNWILKAIYYKGIFAYEETDKTNISENTFDASAIGIEQAQEWISKNTENYNSEEKR